MRGSLTGMRANAAIPNGNPAPLHVEEHTLLPRLAHKRPKQRLEWSALLLFVLGLCSLASPHLMRHAHVHHTSTSGSPSSHSGRTSSRSSSRSSNRGGTQSELDRDRLHDELSGLKRKPAEVSSSILNNVAAAALPAGVVLPRIALARSALPSTADTDLPSSPALRLSRGRAPPTV